MWAIKIAVEKVKFKKDQAQVPFEKKNGLPYIQVFSPSRLTKHRIKIVENDQGGNPVRSLSYLGSWISIFNENIWNIEQKQSLKKPHWKQL